MTRLSAHQLIVTIDHIANTLQALFPTTSMEFILPNSLSALRENETFTRHNITIDPDTFLGIIRHAELGCKIGHEGQEFHNEVDKQSFGELMPEDPALYDVRTGP
jgi:hypothetical protein